MFPSQGLAHCQGGVKSLRGGHPCKVDEPLRDLKLPDQRHPEKAHRPDQEQPKKPAWIRVKAPTSEGYRKTRDILREKSW